MATPVLTPQNLLATGRIIAKQKAPYMASAIFALIPKEMPGLATMAVTERGVLLWDPEWLKTLTPDQVGWVLLHEASHLLRDHCKRCKTYAADPRLWNIAADAEINDDIREMHGNLPDGAIYPELLGCEKGGVAETYYGALRKQAQPKQGSEGSGEGQGEDGDGSGGGKGKGGEKEQQGKDSKDGKDGKPSPAGGWCGSGAGRKVPGEPEDGTGGGPGRSHADLQRVRLQVAEAVRAESAKGQGNVPAGLRVWADGLLKPAKVPWRQLLARAIRGALAYQAGSVDYSYSRPARRQGAVGWGRGMPVLPTLRGPRPRVAVAIDTSGSMGRGEIERAASECAGILKATAADVALLACDAAVHTVTQLRHPRELAQALKGGGGTSFVPIFQTIAAMRDAPGILVILTDGGGDAPATPPKNIDRVIWVLVGSHKCRPFFHDASPGFGTFVEVDE